VKMQLEDWIRQKSELPVEIQQSVLEQVGKCWSFIGLVEVKKQMARLVKYLIRCRHYGLEMPNIILQGPPGSGKSTFSVALASMLRCLQLDKISQKEEKTTTPTALTLQTMRTNSWNAFLEGVQWQGEVDRLQQEYEKVRKTRTQKSRFSPYPGMKAFLAKTTAQSCELYQYCNTALHKEKENEKKTSGSCKESKDAREEPKKDVLHVTRADLIGEYLGQTAPKTRRICEGCHVLIIDEAHSLYYEDSDMYGKEAVDTLVDYMSRNPQFRVILNCYADKIQTLFRLNSGFERRFIWKLNLEEKLTGQHLQDIFLQQVRRSPECKLTEEMRQHLPSFFKEHCSLFKFFGGDTEKLLLHCKMLSMDTDDPLVITKDVLQQAFDAWRKEQQQDENSDVIMMRAGMYV
jgi:DNA polymerase III delta prime subunit